MAERLPQTPRISFCITCKGRFDHVRKTLEKNIRDNADYANAEFVLLDYDSQDGLQQWVKENFREEIASGRLVYAHSPDHEHFLMSHAKNMAHRLASGDILVNLDADNFTGPGFASWIARQYDKFEKTSDAKQYEGLFLHKLLADVGIGAKIGIQPLKKGVQGRVALSRDAFYKLGGYHEGVVGHGSEVENLTARLDKLNYRYRDIEERFADCILHADALRKNAGKIGPDGRVIVYENTTQLEVLEAKKLQPNGGNFGCGTVRVLNRDFTETTKTLAPIERMPHLEPIQNKAGWSR